MVHGAYVGRQRTLADLRREVVDAGLGRGRLVLIAGEPGIGKTSLAVETSRFAAEQGMEVRQLGLGNSAGPARMLEMLSEAGRYQD